MSEDVIERLERMESLLKALVERETVKEWYSTKEFGALIGKSEPTVREHCRYGRLNARRRRSGRGAHPSWVLSHDEYLRYQKEGLLPLPAVSRTYA